MRRFVASLAILLCTSIAAADLSGLYDDATLDYWGERYRLSTNRILDEVIWPALLSREKQALGRKPVLEFPRRAPGHIRQDPLVYYVPGNRYSIVLPVFSLKFLDDLCIAYAWLQVNDYGLETVSEYTAILRYSEPPPGGFPPPLQALQIPADALDDPRVDQLALGHFVTARTFILLHEIGHLLNPSMAPGIANEQQADRFAATVMQRTPLPPLGMLVYFLAAAHWSVYPTNRDATHPLSGARVSALAEHVNNPGLITELKKLGQLIDDPDIRAGFIATGKAGDLNALAPRRPGELPGRRSSDRAIDNMDVPFDGVYQGEFVQLNDPEREPRSIELVLERHGDHVIGYYSFGLGVGRINWATVHGDQLYFQWEWAGNFGKGVLEAQVDGSFTGTWGYRESRDNAGIWSGRRVR